MKKAKLTLRRATSPIDETATNVAVITTNLSKQAQPLILKLNKVEIETEADYQNAATLISNLKAISKAAENEMKKFTVPLNELLKVTRSHFKPFFDKIASIEGAKKSEMVAFLNRQETAKKRLEAQFESGKIKKASTLMAKTEELSVGAGDATARKIKVVRIVDESKIPRSFLAPNIAAIKAHLIAGDKVAGCELIEEFNVAI